MTDPTDADAELMKAAVKRSHDQYKLNTSRAAFQAGAIFGSAFRTPQPTQPAAGAVPLTLEAINAMAREYPAEDLCGWSYRMGVADTERAHGIKGGQHGADT